MVDMILNYTELLAQFLFALMIVATIVTRVIPGKSDDEMVADIWKKTQKVLGYLPTFGINPRTKELQKALDRVNGRIPDEKKKPEDNVKQS